MALCFIGAGRRLSRPRAGGGVGAPAPGLGEDADGERIRPAERACVYARAHACVRACTHVCILGRGGCGSHEARLDG